MSPKSFDKNFGSNTFSRKDKVNELKEVLKGQKENEDQAQTGDVDSSKDMPALKELAGADHQILDEEIQVLKEKLKKTEVSLAEQTQKTLRAMADLENTRKRLQKEYAESIKYANERLIQDFLPIIDNLEFSLSHVFDQNFDSQSKNKKEDAVVEGVRLVLKQFIDVLEKSGVEIVSGEGEPFDPHKQEAIGHEETDAYPDHHVISVHRKGFLLNGRLVRPALVTVAKSKSSASH